MSGMEDEREKILETISAGAPFRIPDADLVRLNDFVSEYLLWASRIHLVSRRAPASSLATQIMESIYMLDFAENLLSGRDDKPCRVADIGTGYGFPGLVWSLLRDELAMTLIERKDKCVSFLEMMIPRLGIGGVAVVKANAGKDDIKQRFDLVTTKAAGRLSGVIPIVSGLIRDSGVYITIKEADWEWELGGVDPGEMALLSTRDLPGMTGVLLAFGKNGQASPR